MTAPADISVNGGAHLPRQLRQHLRLEPVLESHDPGPAPGRAPTQSSSSPTRSTTGTAPPSASSTRAAASGRIFGRDGAEHRPDHPRAIPAPAPGRAIGLDPSRPQQESTRQRKSQIYETSTDLELCWWQVLGPDGEKDGCFNQRAAGGRRVYCVRPGGRSPPAVPSGPGLCRIRPSGFHPATCSRNP